MRIKQVSFCVSLVMYILLSGCPMGNGGLVPLPRANENSVVNTNDDGDSKGSSGLGDESAAGDGLNANESPDNGGIGESNDNGDGASSDSGDTGNGGSMEDGPGVEAPIGSLLLGRWDLDDPSGMLPSTIVEYTAGDSDAELICTNLNDDGSLKLDETGAPIVPATLFVQPGGMPTSFEVLDTGFPFRYEITGADNDGYEAYFILEDGSDALIGVGSLRR